MIPGGTHADGLTYNALVVSSWMLRLETPHGSRKVLPDGVYLELVAFTRPIEGYPEGSPERRARASHRWASALPGVIDFAHLGLDAHVSDTINSRADAQLYLDAVAGGRTRPDGRQLRWRINAPARPMPPGALPFFCEDVTPRELRVPGAPLHANRVQGVLRLRVLCAARSFDTQRANFVHVTGRAPVEDQDGCSVWRLDSPSGKNATQLILSVPQAREEREYLEHRGDASGAIYGVDFRYDD